MTKHKSNFKQTLWKTADSLRAQMDAAEYKHIVLGLIFLKYISDSFVGQKEEIRKMVTNPDSDFFISENLSDINEQDLEDRDYYTQDNVFWVPESARWETLRDQAKQSDIGAIIDRAMGDIESENQSLKGKLDKRFGRTELQAGKLGELIDLISKITFSKEQNSKDILGEVYEFFLGKFAIAEGKKGGQYYTPTQVVKTLVSILSPYKGRIYDPCCGSGGMFVQSDEFIRSHGGRRDDISIYGQESNPTTWRLAAMNLAIRGFSVDLGNEHGDTFEKDQHHDKKFDFIMANPPFNISDWDGEKYDNDPRWIYGRPPNGNANYAWIQHILWKLKSDGKAGVVLANMSLASNNLSEKKIRKELIRKDLVECIVNLPDKLFSTTPIGACLWILNKEKNYPGNILFIDSNKDFEKISRTLNLLPESSIGKISKTYSNWCSERDNFANVPSYASSVSIEEVLSNDASLFPAAYLEYSNDENKLPVDSKPLNLTRGDPEVNSQFFKSASSKISELITLAEKDLNFKTYRIGDILEQSSEKLGDSDEPEILTCTETTGLVLQKDRFLNRVATENTSKYKLVLEGDIVYNPYLLWSGSIDQCWIVDRGITSPAYQVFRVKEGIDKGLVGLYIKTPQMLAKYDGISVGTVKRRRRAPPEKFLELQIDLPEIENVDVESLMIEMRELNLAMREFKSLLNEFAQRTLR